MGPSLGPFLPITAGPGAGKGEPEALHWAGTAFMLHARVRERARVELNGSWKGTLADITRQAQSTLVFTKDLNDSQHVLDGTAPLLVLPVIKFAHGVKLLIIDVVHGVLICPVTAEFPPNITINTADITAM